MMKREWLENRTHIELAEKADLLLVAPRPQTSWPKLGANGLGPPMP